VTDTEEVMKESEPDALQVFESRTMEVLAMMQQQQNKVGSSSGGSGGGDVTITYGRLQPSECDVMNRRSSSSTMRMAHFVFPYYHHHHCPPHSPPLLR